MFGGLSKKSKPGAPARSARYTRYIARPVLLEEVGPPGLVRGTMLMLAGGVAAFIIWAAVSQLTEATHASGFVTPVGAVKIVQHLEGGIVSEILSRDGDIVEAGQPIVAMDDTAQRAELDEQQSRLVSLELHAERLRAFAEGRTPDFTDYPAAYGSLVADQLSILKLQTEARDKQRQVSLLQIEQRRSELGALNAQRRTLEERIAIVGEILGMRGELLKKGLVSRILYLTTKQELNAASGERANTVKRISRAREAIAEARGTLARIDADLRNEAAGEMGRLTSEIAAVRQSIKRLTDRVRRLRIRATAAGVLKGLTVNTVGSVVPPGGVIAEIVPIDAALVVEARLKPSDIGTLRAGQTASVKVQTFDFARHGSVEGTLERISATTFTAEDGSVYYKATVRLAKNYVGNRPTENLILPGMTVDVGVNTGEGSLLRYLLRPVYESLDSAFSEP